MKAGINHFVRLYRWNRPRFYYHADKEKLFRETINDKATILRLRRGGETRPITLYELAQMIDVGETFGRVIDSDDGCGCFAPVLQERMDDMLLNVDVKRSTP